MKKTIAIYLILLLILSGCKSDVPFAVIGSEGPGEILILLNGDTVAKARRPLNDYNVIYAKGMFINFHKQGKVKTVYIDENSMIIKSHVFDYKSNETFMVLDQKPLDLIFGEIEIINNSARRPRDPENGILFEEMLYNSPIHRYWIINKISKDFYGDFTKEEYLQKRKELGVPDDLKLKFEK